MTTRHLTHATTLRVEFDLATDTRTKAALARVQLIPAKGGLHLVHGGGRKVQVFASSDQGLAWLDDQVSSCMAMVADCGAHTATGVHWSDRAKWWNVVRGVVRQRVRAYWPGEVL